MISLEAALRQTETTKGGKVCLLGGNIGITGEGIPEGTSIGVGVARFLAGIPEQGVDLQNPTDGMKQWDVCKATVEDWLENILSKAGLVEKTEDGTYRLTEAAKQADYMYTP